LVPSNRPDQSERGLGKIGNSWRRSSRPVSGPDLSKSSRAKGRELLPAAPLRLSNMSCAEDRSPHFAADQSRNGTPVARLKMPVVLGLAGSAAYAAAAT